MQKDSSCFRTVIQIMLLSCVCACLFVRVQFIMPISNLTLSNFSHLASQHLITPFALFLFLPLSLSVCLSLSLSQSLTLYLSMSPSLPLSLSLSLSFRYILPLPLTISFSSSLFFFTYHRCRCHLPGSAGAIDLLQLVTPHFLNLFVTKTRKCKKKKRLLEWKLI